MKKLFIYLNVLALSVGAGVTVYGKTINENTAKTVGGNYLMSMGIPGVKSASDLSTAYVASAASDGSLITDYYVFNITGGKGFIIVSADDQIIPILAYSNEASFDINKAAPDAKWWMNGYANQITYAIENSLPAKTGTAERWNNLKAGVLNTNTNTNTNTRSAARTTGIFPSDTAHLIHTTWNQNAPNGNYNMYCPGYASGVPTGCVATCMAEVMQYWNWPTIGCGYHSYVQSTTPTFGVQSADFGNTAYDWTTMDANLTASTTATALLMFHCGIAVDMDYTSTSEGSGSYVTQLSSPIINCAEYALKTYFHYKRTLQGYLRSGEPGLIAAIPDVTWDDTIEAELNAGRPVMYTGQGSDGGHCWICDGYNSDIMYHFNFGWDGLSNGFYSIDDVAPSALGTGGGGSGNNFNSDQSIIVDIEPDSFSNTPGNIELASNLNSTVSSPLGYGSPFSFSTTIKNAGTSSFSGSFCARVYDTSNNLMGTIQTLSSQTVAADGTSGTLTFSTTAMYNLIAEDYYHVQVLYEPSGSSTWTPVANNGTFINYNILSVINDTDISLWGPTEVTSTLPVPLASTIAVFSQIGDYSTNNFSGTISAELISISTGTVYPIQSLAGSTLGAGLYNNFTFSGSIGTAPTGDYALEIKHQYNGTGSFYVTGNYNEQTSVVYENPILIHVGSTTGVQAITAMEDKVSVYPNPANDIININAQGINLNTIRIVDIDGREVTKIDAGNQSELSIPVSNLASGVYFIQLQSGSDVITRKIVIAK